MKTRGPRKWSRITVQGLNAMTAEQWTWERENELSPAYRLKWAWVFLCQNLTWQYGEDGALQRLNGELRRAA